MENRGPFVVVICNWEILLKMDCGWFSVDGW